MNYPSTPVLPEQNITVNYNSPSGATSNIAGLCIEFAALGQRRHSGGLISPTDIDMQLVDDSASNEPEMRDPDFYDVNYVPLPQIVANKASSKISRFSEFRTSFACPPHVVAGKRVLSCGVSMLSCLEGNSNMIDGQKKLHSGWGENNGRINVVISWPGYDAHSLSEISVYDDANKKRITRAELAKLIAMDYFMFFDFLTFNENNAENGQAHQIDAIGQDPLWRVGYRGYMFDRLHIMSVTQTFDNFCKVEISVMTAKGFPHSVQYP